MTKNRTNGNETTDTADREIVTTRIFDAPRELVWKAWTDPKRVAQWWGPNGFTNTVHQMDVKPGGVWQLTMHGPDGVDYPNKIIFTEVAEPERLAYVHGGNVEGGAGQFHVTVTFDDLGGKTKLTMRMLFDTTADYDTAVKTFGAIEGNKQTLARLAEHLEKLVV
jgi:uncharacterized protein YndB with AHSA1/START domain